MQSLTTSILRQQFQAQDAFGSPGLLPISCLRLSSSDIWELLSGFNDRTRRFDLERRIHRSWVLPNNKLHSGLVMWTRDKQHLSLQDVRSQSQLPHVLSPAWFWFQSDSSARLGESHFIWGFLMLHLSLRWLFFSSQLSPAIMCLLASACHLLASWHGCSQFSLVSPGTWDCVLFVT